MYMKLYNVQPINVLSEYIMYTPGYLFVIVFTFYTWWDGQVTISYNYICM